MGCRETSPTTTTRHPNKPATVNGWQSIVFRVIVPLIVSPLLYLNTTLRGAVVKQSEKIIGKNPRLCSDWADKHDFSGRKGFSQPLRVAIQPGGRL